jgi:transposase
MGDSLIREELPMWTSENRAQYDRDKLRYPSDLTYAEWEHIEPLIPPAKRGGRKRSVDVREVVNGLMYVLSTGCQWRYVPKDLPPRSTLFDYFGLWTWNGTLDRIHHALYVKCREAMGSRSQPDRLRDRQRAHQDACPQPAAPAGRRQSVGGYEGRGPASPCAGHGAAR